MSTSTDPASAATAFAASLDASAPYSHAELVAALDASRRVVVGYFRSIPEPAFFTGDAKSWGPVHQLGHLALSHGRMSGGFQRKDALPAHPTGVSRGYAEMKAFYEAGLATAPASFINANPFTAAIEPGATRAGVVAEFTRADEALVDAVRAWTDRELDARALKHPVLGVLTAREMLLFCLQHDARHVANVQARLAGGAPGRVD
jgi:hypothetical protein